MLNTRAILLAAFMLAVAVVLRGRSNDTATGLSTLAIFGAWFALGWSIRLKWGRAGVEQWKEIRQRGRAYFVLVHGCWWFAFILLYDPSLDLAAGQGFNLRHFWSRLLIALCMFVATFWEWKRREKKYSESSNVEPVPFDGVP